MKDSIKAAIKSSGTTIKKNSFNEKINSDFKKICFFRDGFIKRTNRRRPSRKPSAHENKTAVISKTPCGKNPAIKNKILF